MAYLHKFETVSAFTEARTENYREPWVSAIVENRRVNYNKTDEEKREELLNKPLTFKVTSDGVVRWRANRTANTITIEYKKNDGEWESITSATGDSAPSISVVSGDILQFRGDNETYCPDNTTEARNTFSGTTCGFEVEGNIMSLINSTGFSAVTVLSSSHTFYSLFNYCTGLTQSKNLILPALTLTNYCYGDLFNTCKYMLTSPELPATTLADNCYSSMFFYCHNMTDSPDLMATTIAYGCYSNMFAGCSSMTYVQETLPATTLQQRCYLSMYSGCKNLLSAPSLPATIMQNACYQAMFQNCTSLTEAPELPAETLAASCYTKMFSACTSLTDAPNLPASAISINCYCNMFADCVSMTGVPATLPATTLQRNCYERMFYRCSGITTAPVLPATALAGSCYNYMFSGCSSLNYIKAMFTTTPNSNYTYKLVAGVASSGTVTTASS